MGKTDLNELRSYFEDELDRVVLDLDTPIEMIKPMLYSLKNGGKRLRPMLLLAVLDAEGGKNLKKGAITAIALEYIHTYSLIHDDLPAMDNDDMRRGQPTSHVKFDEATAILAGDALLTDAFGLIANDSNLKNKQKVKLISALSAAAGSSGMVNGQLNDIQADDLEIQLSDLKQIHYGKTGKLFIFATEAAAIIAELDKETTGLLKDFSEAFGVAYQIHNDILDVQDDILISGRDYSSDQFNGKSTYPAFLGIDGAKKALAEEVDKVNEVIDKIKHIKGKDYKILEAFVSFLAIKE